MELKWFRDHGLIGSYADFRELPHALVEDCRLVIQAEAEDAKRRAPRG